MKTGFLHPFLTKSSSCNTLSDQECFDKSVLRELFSQEFLKYTPSLSYQARSSCAGNPAQTLPHTDGSGDIQVFSEDLNTVSEQMGGLVLQQLNKWLIVFHEASHNEFYTDIDVFLPTTTWLSANDVALINHWGMNRLCVSVTSQMLSEAFADTYASIMLLEGLSHNKDSLQAVENLLHLRSVLQTTNAAPLYAASAESLNFLLQERLQWKGLPPEQLKKIARHYSSNAIVETALKRSAGSLDPFAHLVDVTFRVQPFLFEFCCEHLSGRSDHFIRQSEKILKPVPIWNEVKKMCLCLREELDHPSIAATQELKSILQNTSNHHDAFDQSKLALLASTQAIVEHFKETDPVFCMALRQFKRINTYLSEKTMHFCSSSQTKMHSKSIV